MKRMSMAILVCAVVSMAILLAGVSHAAPPAKDKIRVGWVISLSGPYASGVPVTMGNVYEMWVEEVNAKGGIYIKEYGKKLPLEVIKYDDKSDVGNMTKLLEKVILEDKVDMIFAPWSTAMLYAAAPIANKYKYVLLGASGSADKLSKELPKLPYVFSVLNTGGSQMPPLAEVLSEVGAKKVAIIYIQDLHGIEYRDAILPALKKKNIQVTMSKSFPHGTKDLTPLLKDAKAANVDAFLAFLYPDEAFMVTGQAMEVGFNPKAFYMTVGPCLSQYRDAFSARGVEGVMGAGAWNAKTSPAAKEFRDAFVKRWKAEPEYWGTLFYYSSLQFLQEAIEAAGTLNQTKIRDVMATKTFNTAMGPMSFKKGVNTNHPGEIGQWQNGVFEILDPGKKRTAAPIYPKPEWPQKTK
ncbi:MAG: amino acid ABC transporter substrate-binding protein [Syntrophorhabdales bacterium]